MIFIMGFVIYLMSFMICFCLGVGTAKIPNNTVSLLAAITVWVCISMAVVWIGKTYLVEGVYLSRLNAQIPVAAAGIFFGVFTGKICGSRAKKV